jgi:hypothetical protein
MSDIEGKAARVVASECGQRASFNDEIRKRETPNAQRPASNAEWITAAVSDRRLQCPSFLH